MSRQLTPDTMTTNKGISWFDHLGTCICTSLVQTHFLKAIQVPIDQPKIFSLAYIMERRLSDLMAEISVFHILIVPTSPKEPLKSGLLAWEDVSVSNVLAVQA